MGEIVYVLMHRVEYEDCAFAVAVSHDRDKLLDVIQECYPIFVHWDNQGQDEWTLNNEYLVIDEIEMI